MPGCVSTSDIEQQIAVLQDRMSEEASHIDDLQARLDDLPPPDEATDEENAMRLALEAAIEAARLREQAYRTAIEHGELVIGEAESFGQTPIGQAISELVPEPYRSLGLLAAGVGGALWQRRRLYRAAATIVRTLEDAKDGDPAFAESFDTNTERIRRGLARDPIAKKIVDTERG